MPARKPRKPDAVTIQLKLAQWLRPRDAEVLIEQARTLAAGQVRPLFPDSHDQDLCTYYVVEAASNVEADQLLSRMKGSKGVEVLAKPAARKAKTGR